MHLYGTHSVLLLWNHQLKKQLAQNTDFDLLVMRFPFLKLKIPEWSYSEVVHDGGFKVAQIPFSSNKRLDLKFYLPALLENNYIHIFVSKL